MSQSLRDRRMREQQDEAYAYVVMEWVHSSTLNSTQGGAADRPATRAGAGCTEAAHVCIDRGQEGATDRGGRVH